MPEKKRPSDEELRDLVRSIDRKQFAVKEVAKYGEAAISTDYLELQITELRDRTEAKCLVLLLKALKSEDPMAIQDFFLIVEDAAKRHRSFEGDEIHFAEQLFAGLFKYLVRQVIAEIDEEPKQKIIERLKVFDEDSKE